MLFTRYLLLASGFWLTTPVDGYKIDASCQRQDKEVDDAMKSAFDMARAGKAALDSGVNRHPVDADLQPPRPPELEGLIANIFAHQDIIDKKTPPSPAKPEMWNYHMTLKNLKLFKVFMYLDNIVKNLGQQTDNPTPNDAVIYCDETSLKFSPDKKTATDSDRGNIKIAGGGKQAVDLYRCVTTGQFTLAITYGNLNHPTTYEEYSSRIQLCKGTVENVKKRKLAYWGAFRRSNPFQLVGGKFNQWAIQSGLFTKFAEVDALKLLDVTLLHEMTHTRGGGSLDDVKVGGTSGYQWKNIKSLAKIGDYVEGNKKTQPDFNSDSIAYFGLGCFLMSDPSGAYKITSKGRLQKLNNPVTFP